MTTTEVFFCIQTNKIPQSLVSVFGYEYCFGHDGIVIALPESPTRMHSVGFTTVSEKDFCKFIDDLRNRFNSDTFNPESTNSGKFADEIIEFLCRRRVFGYAEFRSVKTHNKSSVELFVFNKSKYSFVSIWHVSVVVFGTEYQFFISGIKITHPGYFSKYRNPLRKHTICYTSVSKEAFEDHLHKKLKNKYNNRSYNISSNSCNTFSEEIVRFLCNANLPDYILRQNRLAEKFPIIECARKFLNVFGL